MYFLFNITTLPSFCDIPYRCSICEPFAILQTSTWKPSSFQTICSTSACSLLTAVRRHLNKPRSKQRNAQLLHTAHHKRKLREFLDPSVQLYTPISSLLCMTSC